jgi:hypothetical protein
MDIAAFFHTLVKTPGTLGVHLQLTFGHIGEQQEP